MRDSIRPARLRRARPKHARINAGYIPLGAPVVVIPLDGSRRLLETDVVEASEGRAADVLDRVVRHQEVLLHRTTTRDHMHDNNKYA